MTTMISELYEALVDAGATEAKAREAAVVLSAEDLNSKDNIAEVKEDLASDIAGLDEKLSGKITELDQRLSGKITGLDQRLSGKITELDQRLSGKITGLDQRLSGKITELDQRLSGKITELDQKLSGEIAETREDIHKIQLEMAVLRWMLGTTLAGVAAILASVVPILVKLFFTA